MLVSNSREKNKVNNIRKLDIRGKVCPMTFVYTKLELEKMKKGELLEVTLDFPAAVKNIPDSCERQKIGVVLRKNELNREKKEWVLQIKKL